MDAIDTLKQEHRIIEKALIALEKWVEKVRAAAADDRDELARFVSFMRRFADACHHGKEETILFATMEQSGFSREAGPLAVMLQEHARGRALVATLDELARQEAPWDAEDRERLAQTARAYAALLRQHIQKEDQVLYPMANAELPDSTMAEIAERFERFEDEETGSGEHERLHDLAESLITAHAPLEAEAHAHHHH